MGADLIFGLPDFSAPGVATALVLTALRIGGLLLIAPAWSAKSVPMKLRTAMLVLFAVLLLPTALATTDRATLAITPATFLAETAIGFAFGFAAALVIAGAEFAGELMTTTIGLSGAAIFDPVNNTQGAIFGSFMQLMALTLLLITGGHIVMIEAIAKSFSVLPLGAPIDMQAGFLALTKAGGTIFATGLQFAAPVIAAILVTNIALAILGRAAPQLQIMSLAFPLQIGIGLLTFAGSVGLIVHALGEWTTPYGKTIDAFVRGARVATVQTTSVQTAPRLPAMSQGAAVAPSAEGR
ncbi:MAG TPA: type III secretion protein [Gemmatimonas aurantiaca]|uniref:Flagellar biosynthetic protein FliR n=2 Tax=Gemmatimonas aurantiaca TaxID=173480 RepID=C1A548_GEMAT|nr:flagellar biosynthetic protein FliR [Gemmatimonas aurantiaca]BAH37358.1 flagellar biosynthetic protein FliR [Gemmatimonas aurantiaca T-27]HCT55774.1 type III secretion protein [Gemmatimonas aurantiaca]